MSSAIPAPGSVRSSMKTFVIRLLMIEGLVGAYDLDHRTTPEVVRISKESSILRTRRRNVLIDVLQLEGAVIAFHLIRHQTGILIDVSQHREPQTSRTNWTCVNELKRVSFEVARFLSSPFPTHSPPFLKSISAL